MKNLLEDLYSDVLTAPTIEAFKVELIKFGKKLGFDLVIADYGSPPPKRAWTSINNYPKKWLELSIPFDDDLVGRAVKKTSRPLLWDAEQYKQSGLGHMAELFVPYGLSAGFDVPTHAPDGAIMNFGFSRDSALPKDPDESVRVVAEAQLFSTFAFPTLARLLAHTMQADFPKLTPKELEVLRWSMEGKTAFEVGAILGMAERTANFHVQNICKKRGVFNKNSAIVKALELKLIV